MYLSEEELALLDKRAVQTGATRSELIRRAIRHTYGAPSRDQLLQLLRASSGIWKDRAFSGSEYVEAFRGGLKPAD